MSAESTNMMNNQSTIPSQQDRLLQIRSDFLEMTKNSSSIFSLDALVEILSLKSGKPFEPSYVKEIFDHSSTPYSSKITTEDFVTSFYSIETELKSKVDVMRKQLKDKSIKLTNTKRQLIEAKANKIPEDNNVLTITVKSTNVLSPKTLIARVICDDWEVTSNPANGQDPKWDETFTFNPLSHRNIIIELWESEKINLIKCLGRVEIKLASLKDEALHNDSLKVYDKLQVIGEIQIAAQWIMVKVDYLERLVKDIEKNLAEERKIFDGFEKKHAEFLSPFTKSQPIWFTENPKFKKAELELSNQLDDFALKTFGKKVKWPRALEFSVYVYLALSAINMVLRPDFVTVSGIAFFWYSTLQPQEINYRLLSIFVLFSQFYDFFWMYTYAIVTFTQTWFDSSFVAKLIVIISLINFQAKLIFAAIFWKNSLLNS